MQQYPATPGISSGSQPRQFYPITQYPDISTGVTGPYADAAATGAFLPSAGLGQACFVPELGMQVGFYPENLFALGNMLDEGFFNLPSFGDAGVGTATGSGEGAGGFYGYGVNR